MNIWSENYEEDVKAAARIFERIDHWPTEDDIKRIAEELKKDCSPGSYITTAGLVVVKIRRGVTVNLFIDPHIAGLYLGREKGKARAW